MKPSARTRTYRRRLLATLAFIPSLGYAAGTVEQACRIPVTEDPRLEMLRKADPDDPHIDVTSDHGDLSQQGDAELSGNVSIRTGQRLLTSDEATIDSANRSITVKGKVEYLDPTIHVTGREGQFEKGAGDFEGAKFDLVDGSGRGSAKSARLHDQTMLDLDTVRYTVCPPGNDDWILKAQQISLDQEAKTGTARDVRLDFLGVPILYTPWISFPLSDERKSGLLFPAIGSGGQSGTQVVVPWYWNIAPNYDATFTNRWYSSRGYRIDPEFRFLTERSHGVFNAQVMPHDQELDEYRGLYDLKETTLFDPKTRALIDAAYVTDRSYFEDFGAGFEGTSIIFLNQFGELRRDTEHWTLVGRAQNYQVLDPALARDEYPYSMLPQLVVGGHWDGLARGLSAALDAEAVNFYRATGPQGFRLDAQPALTWGIGGRGGYIDATAAWRYTTYALHDTAPGTDNSLDRSLPIISVDSGFVLERPVGSKDQRLQTLEPRIQYVYVPYRNQDDIPIFDTDQPTLNMVELFRTNRYVGADRVGDANLVSTGLTTRLLDASSGQQYLSATIGEAFYFQQPRVTLPGEEPTNRSSSNVIAEIDLEAFKHWSSRLGYQWDPDANQTERMDFGVQYRPASDRVVNAVYRYQRDQLEQFDVSAAWPFLRNWHGFARWVYSLSENKTLDQFVGVEYSSCCWAIRLVTRHFVSNRSGQSDNSIGFQLELKGLSSVGVDNEAFLREQIRGYSALATDPQSQP